jgi:pyruvate-formate lyase-activating enzyme
MRNIELTLGMEIRLIIRIPLIFGINDGDKAAEGMVEYISGLEHYQKVDLLPYHRWGMG